MFGSLGGYFIEQKLKSTCSKFEEDHTFEYRLRESTLIKEKFPDRLPFIVERRPGTNYEEISKNKYLVPTELTIAKFIYTLRKRLRLTPEQALYVYINNQLPSNSSLIVDIYNEYKNEDGFVYMFYAMENTFG